MDDLRKAAEIALEALEMHVLGCDGVRKMELAIESLEAALAQPEQEPVVWMQADQAEVYVKEVKDEVRGYTIPLYTAPPSKPWVSLTDDEIVQIVRKRGWGQSYFSLIEIIEFTRDNEAALRKKNDSSSH